MTIEIVDFPIKNDDFPWLCQLTHVKTPQTTRTSWAFFRVSIGPALLARETQPWPESFRRRQCCTCRKSLQWRTAESELGLSQWGSTESHISLWLMMTNGWWILHQCSQFCTLHPLKGRRILWCDCCLQLVVTYTRAFHAGKYWVLFRAHSLPQTFSLPGRNRRCKIACRWHLLLLLFRLKQNLFPLHWCWPSIIIIIIMIMAGVGANSRASPRNVGGTWGRVNTSGRWRPRTTSNVDGYTRVPGWNEKNSLARNVARENDINDNNSMEMGVPNYITITNLNWKKVMSYDILWCS